MIGAGDIKNLILGALAFLLLFVAAAAQAQLTYAWKTEHNWYDKTGNPDNPNETYKDLYHRWVEDGEDVVVKDSSGNEKKEYRGGVTTNMFTAPDSPLAGLPVVCSTAAEAPFINFAYVHHLPFAIQEGNKLLTNETPCLQPSSAPDGTFREFAKKVLESHYADHVNTGTLSRDTFPVSIERKYVKPGLILLYYQPNDPKNHTNLLVHTTDTGNLHFYSASIEEKPQDLAETEGIEKPPHTDGRDGLRDFNVYECEITRDKCANYKRRPLSEEPGSKEYAEAHGETFVDQFDQTKFHRESWGQDVTDTVGVTRQGDPETLDGLVRSACSAIKQRAEYVKTAVAAVGGSCPARDSVAPVWLTHSTVSKDERIWSFFKRIDAVVATYYGDSYAGYKSAIERRNTDFTDQPECKELYREYPDTPSMLWLRYIFKNRLASADPTDGTQDRWGATNVNVYGPIPQESVPMHLIPENWPDEYGQICVVSKNKKNCPLDPALAKEGAYKAESCPSKWLPRANSDFNVTSAQAPQTETTQSILVH